MHYLFFLLHSLKIPYCKQQFLQFSSFLSSGYVMQPCCGCVPCSEGITGWIPWRVPLVTPIALYMSLQPLLAEIHLKTWAELYCINVLVTVVVYVVPTDKLKSCVSYGDKDRVGPKWQNKMEVFHVTSSVIQNKKHMLEFKDVAKIIFVQRV